jgi:hypothetical protein
MSGEEAPVGEGHDRGYPRLSRTRNKADPLEIDLVISFLFISCPFPAISAKKKTPPGSTVLMISSTQLCTGTDIQDVDLEQLVDLEQTCVPCIFS